MDVSLENAMEVLTKLSDLYDNYKDAERSTKVISELEKLEIEFSAAHESAREYLDSRRDELSSIASETLHIDMEKELNIAESPDQRLPIDMHEESEKLREYSGAGMNSDV